MKKPPVSLTDEIKDRFARVLITYPFTRGSTRKPPKPGANWQVEHERRYGCGHYDDRRYQLFDIVLPQLVKKADLDAIYQALWQAHKAMFDLVMRGKSAAWGRNFVGERAKINRNLGKWVSRALDFLYFDSETSTVGFAPALRQVRDGLKTDPIMMSGFLSPPSGPRGRPIQKDIIKRARKALRLAGAGKYTDDLLEVCGLIPYHK